MQHMKIMTPALKFISIALLATIIAVPAWAVNDRQVREAVEDELGEILPADNDPGGAAVVVRIDGRTLFFNYGTARAACRSHRTRCSIWRRSARPST
jgi:hypothetical protein